MNSKIIPIEIDRRDPKTAYVVFDKKFGGYTGHNIEIVKVEGYVDENSDWFCWDFKDGSFVLKNYFSVPNGLWSFSETIAKKLLINQLNKIKNNHLFLAENINQRIKNLETEI